MTASVETLEVLRDRRIAVTWADGATSRYHFVWLRQQLFHPAIGRPDQGPEDGFRLPDDPETLAVARCAAENGQLFVAWANDGAETRHDLAWLRRNAYDRDRRLARKARPETWTGAEAAATPWLDWERTVQSEEALFELFVALRDRGMARLRGAPARDGEVARLARRLGVLRATDFGQISDIVSRPPESAGRYANIGAGGMRRLAPHTDEGWRYGAPGVGFHLSLEATPGGGGDSMLHDGFLAAARLRENDPDAFALLTRAPFRFAAERNPEERYIAYGRLIVTDQDGDLAGVRFSDRTLDVQQMDEGAVEPAYRALRAFAKELYEPDLVYRHKLRPGECHVFDNHRVLHARAAFDPAAGPRRIQQCAVDREEFHNTYRILAEKLGRADDAAMILPNGALG